MSHSAGAVAPRLLAAVADTVTVLSGASRLLSTPVTVTVPVLAGRPGGDAQLRVGVLSVKSPLTAGATAAADTVTVVASLDARSRVAVTVLMPPFSLIEARAQRQRDRRRRVVVSRSSRCRSQGADTGRKHRVHRAGQRDAPPSHPARPPCRQFTVTSIVLLVSPGANVSVPPAERRVVRARTPPCQGLRPVPSPPSPADRSPGSASP